MLFGLFLFVTFVVSCYQYGISEIRYGQEKEAAELERMISSNQDKVVALVSDYNRAIDTYNEKNYQKFTQLANNLRQQYSAYFNAAQPFINNYQSMSSETFKAKLAKLESQARTAEQSLNVKIEGISSEEAATFAASRNPSNSARIKQDLSNRLKQQMASENFKSLSEEHRQDLENRAQKYIDAIPKYDTGNAQQNQAQGAGSAIAAAMHAVLGREGLLPKGGSQ